MDAERHSGAWVRWVGTLWLTIGLLCLVSIGACRSSVDAIDPDPLPADASGTISGTVRGPEGTSPIDGRLVEAVNVETGERQRATTNPAGGFTFQVMPGKYRLQVALRDGESVLQQPGELRIGASDSAARVNFLIGTVRISAPRYPVYHQDVSLGAPVA